MKKRNQSLTLYVGNVCKPILGDFVKFNSLLMTVQEINRKSGTLLLKDESGNEILVETFKCDFLRRKSLKDQISIYKRYHRDGVRIKQEDYPESEWIELRLRGSESGHPSCWTCVVLC
jgi:hypothetical protein